MDLTMLKVVITHSFIVGDSTKGIKERLRERISVLTERDGVAVDDALHHDLLGIMEDHIQSILDDSNKGSFKELFWQQQMQAAKQKDPRQMKWQMIRWCLHLKLTSGGGYTTLRESGLLKLPSERCSETTLATFHPALVSRKELQSTCGSMLK